jgi:hypothetical protein
MGDEEGKENPKIFQMRKKKRLPLPSEGCWKTGHWQVMLGTLTVPYIL